MNIRFIVVFFCVAYFYSITISASNNRQPNIIYILADDMGIGDVKIYNPNGKIPTPNIDRIANEGMKFTDAHTNSSVCTPTRYGILTGRYAWRTRLKDGVLWGHSPHLINPKRVTVASMMKKQGYATACIGKWHLGMDWASTNGKPLRGSGAKNVDFKTPIKNGPRSNGFDYYFGLAGSLNMDPHAFIENEHIQGQVKYYASKEELTEKGFIQPAKAGWVAKEYKQEKVLSTLADKSCTWIKKNAEKPFFLYLPLPSPHSPIVPSEKFKDISKLSKHGDFCMETDWVVGEVLKTLDELEITDNTLIIFTSDNGTSGNVNFGKHQEMGHYPSLIYRGMKGMTWEGGHRVPFVVRWPQNVIKGTECKQAICSTDLLATCADILDIQISEQTGEDSYSFLPALKQKKILGIEERLIVHHSVNGFFAIRRGKWKLMLENKGGVIKKRHNPKDKPIINNSDLLLFDMDKDPEESINVIDQFPEIAISMKKQLAKIIEEGRSINGISQPTDLKTSQWPQIDLIREYLK